MCHCKYAVTSPEASERTRCEEASASSQRPDRRAPSSSRVAASSWPIAEVTRPNHFFFSGISALKNSSVNARPASKGQYGFAYAMNTSRNEVVCHGVPSTDDILRDGDLVNFDITLEKNGYIADSSKTYLIGDVAPAARRLRCR